MVTTSYDGTARIWDPYQPNTELVRLPLFGQGLAVKVIADNTIAITTSRGFVSVRLGPR
jgi:hypothetical protein